MNTAGALLKEHERESRLYESASSYAEWMKNYAASFARSYPDQSWRDCFRLLENVQQVREVEYDDEVDHIQVRNLVRWNGEGTGMLNERFGITMPDWADAFYRDTREAVLAIRNLIVIFPPEQVMSLTVDHYHPRNETPGPPRILRFAQTWHGSYFAFRRRSSDSQWRVCLIPKHETPGALHSEAWDNVADDADIDTWMQRMLETDGYPLRPGNEEFEEPLVWRIG